jgi:hypothetical protein
MVYNTYVINGIFMLKNAKQKIFCLKEKFAMLFCATRYTVCLARADGNITVIETELGIPSGLWKGKKMSRINIAKPFNHNIR